MTYTFLIDSAKCVGCESCVVACKSEFVDNDWSPYSLPQPMGQFWMNFRTVERGQLPSKMKVSNVPTLCNHCASAPCQKAATGGAIYTRSDGLVIIDPVKAVGQKQLVAACPYGAIYWNAALNVAQKCTGCAHLLDSGWTQPRCVGACPTDAITFGDISALQARITSSGAVPLHPEYGTNPQVFYVSLPKRFIAGALVNQNTGDCLSGATVTAQDLVSGNSYTVTSDFYGDFWFDGLDGNKMYKVTISKSGFIGKTMLAFSGTDKDLGDIMLVGV